MIIKRLIFALILLFLVQFAFADTKTTDQGKKPDGKDTTTKVKTVVKTVPPVEIKVLQVYRLTADTTVKDSSAGIGDIIVVKVKGLKTLLNRSKCKNDSEKVIIPCANQDIKLFINGRMIDDILPETGAPDKDAGTLQYHLLRTPKNDEQWADILGKPGWGDLFRQPVKISVGLANGYAENTIVNEFSFTRIRQHWFYASLIVIGFYLFILFYYGQSKNFLRDGGVDMTPVNVSNVNLLPYSLGKIQMAFWFSLVLISFLFIWLITGNFDMITSSIMGLVGISSVTALSAVAIDNNKGQETIKQIQTLQAQEATVIQTIQGLTLQMAMVPVPVGTGNSLQFNQTAQKEIKNQIKIAIDSIRIESQGLITDILTDANGISFHRLQMLIWTLVLGVIFVYSVWSRLSMPEFSATMLAMQGITSGTYIGFKIPEKQQP